MVDRRSDATVYRLCMADIYAVAEDEFSMEELDLTTEELQQTIRGIEYGMGHWSEVISCALTEAFHESGRKVD